MVVITLLSTTKFYEISQQAINRLAFFFLTFDSHRNLENNIHKTDNLSCTYILMDTQY